MNTVLFEEMNLYCCGDRAVQVCDCAARARAGTEYRQERDDKRRDMRQLFDSETWTQTPEMVDVIV